MSIDLGAKKEEAKKVKPSMSKSLVPGIQVCTIRGISFKENTRFKLDGLDIFLNLEGPDLTEYGFEGFFIDMNNQGLGRYKGPTGSVKLSQYVFATNTFPAKDGKEAQTVTRIDSILAEFGKIATLTDKIEEFYEGVMETDIDMINHANEVFKGTTLRFLIAGQEYQKDGYTKYWLNLPKTNKGLYNMERVDNDPSKLEKFDANKHITKKKEAAQVATFEPLTEEFDVVV